MSCTLITDDSWEDVQKFDYTECSLPAKLAPKLKVKHTDMIATVLTNEGNNSTALNETLRNIRFAKTHFRYVLSYLVSCHHNKYASYQ